MNPARWRPIAVTVMVLCAQASAAQIGGHAGAFTRLGFGARGMGMGNAMAAVPQGDVVGSYNPALIPFTRGRTAGAAFGILALDRKLNFLNYTQPVRPSAGISVGIINSGVSGIDGRDDDGEPTGDLRTSENQVFLSFANRFSAAFSLGLTIKLHYYHLYTDVSATNIGLDLGALLRVTQELTLAATVRDINSQYRWDTAELLGNSGNTTTDRFPLLYTAAASYLLPGGLGILAAEAEFSNTGTAVARAGLEIPVIPELSLRAGVDRIDLKEEGAGVRPSFGFSIRKGFEAWEPALHYAYVLEPFAPSGMHIIALSVTL
jgi:hypothetical protein